MIMASFIGAPDVADPPKKRGSCVVCHDVIPLSVKTYHSLTPRPNNTVDARRKQELKTNIEQVIGQLVDTSLNPRCCDHCFRNVTAIARAEKLKEEMKNRHYLISGTAKTPTKKTDGGRSKRLTHFSPSSASRPDKVLAKSGNTKENTDLAQAGPEPRSVSRTSLFAGEHNIANQRITAEVTINHAGIRKTRTLSPEWTPVAEALYHNQEKAAEEAAKLSTVKATTLSALVDDVKRECTSLCRRDSDSCFKSSSPDALEKWSTDNQDHELAEKAPILYTFLNAAAINETQLTKNKVKTIDAVKHGVVSAAGVLLNCRNKDVNAHQVLTSMQLKHGGASQNTFDRLQKRFLSVNSDTQTKVQDEFRQNFDENVKTWATQMVKDDIEEQQLNSRLNDASDSETASLKMKIDSHNSTRHPGFCLIGDNVDMRTHARYMGIGSQDKDMHMFNMLAAKNRVPGFHLPNDKPIANVADVPLKEYLPSLEDNNSLKNAWIIHVGKIIGKYMGHFRWFTKSLPDVIPHKYSKEAKTKSEIVQLGVIDKNESTHEGMRDITEHMHAYVPKDEDGGLIRILSVGDQLTVERQSAAQEEVRNSKTPSKRREGLMPVTGDFHLLGNFYQCMWKKIYNTGSVGDIGTIYAATKTMSSFNVPTNPMKNINATKVFLDKYTEALVITAALEFFGMSDVDSKPSKNDFDIVQHGDSDTYIRIVLGQLVDQFALPAEEDISGVSGSLRCPKCLKVYTVMDALRNHLKKDHQNSDPDVDTHDAIFAHSCSALTMCLMCHDFTDARQAGDGERIMRLMKYMLLYFRSAGKVKYSLQVLRQLAQVKCLLTPREAHHVIHNRFVNTKGRADTNVELDRVCEASNLVFKTHARNLHGQVTQKALDRISQSCQSVDRVLKRVDKVTSRRPSASKRGGRDHGEDVLKLVGHLAHERVFSKCDTGRYHKTFPGFTRGYVVHIEHAQFHKWMVNTLSGLSRKNVFRT